MDGITFLRLSCHEQNGNHIFFLGLLWGLSKTMSLQYCVQYLTFSKCRKVFQGPFLDLHIHYLLSPPNNFRRQMYSLITVTPTRN